MTPDGTVPAPDVVTPPAGNPRFPALDSLRGLAALSVVIFHAGGFAGTGLVGHAIRHFDVGLTVFFVLSGFLLYRPMIAAALELAPATPRSIFYWRRILRIVPAYWVALVVLSSLITFAKPGVVNFTFIQLYHRDWVLTGIPPAWTICVEASFYLLLPFYAAILDRLLGRSTARRRNELVVLAIGTVLALGVRELLLRFDGANPYALFLLPAIFPWFAVGMALAVIDTRHKAQRWLASPLCWVLALALYRATMTTQRSGSIGRSTFVVYGLIAGLLVAPAIFGKGRLVQVLRWRPLLWLGLVSYGIYLYHYPLLAWAAQHIHEAPAQRFAELLAFGVIAATLCGAASYYIVERPVLRLKNPSRLPTPLRRLLRASA